MNIIAEIGTSHQGNIKKAFELIDCAASCGADTVKFQWVYADEILHPDTGFVNLPTGKIPLYQRFRELEVNKSFFKKCVNYSHKKGVKFACSPFGIKSLEELVSLNPDYIKIASPELNHIPLLEKLSEYYRKIPIIISSGVSKEEDIELAIKTIAPDYNPLENKCPNGEDALTLLHCSTFYPTPEEEYNVKLVKTLSEKFQIPAGISDHSLNSILVPVLATLEGATTIEKHITLSNETDGLDDPVALNPENFSLMCHTVKQTVAVIQRFQKEHSALKNGEKVHYIPQEAIDFSIQQLKNQFSEEKINACIGNGIKVLSKSEEANYGRTNRSIHYMKNLKKGDVISEKDISVLRTEKILTPGIHPKYLHEIIGRKLNKNVTNGSGVQFEDFE